MTVQFAIAGRPVGPGHPPYIVAELSANHNGSLDHALAIVDAAADAGAEAIKLQTYTADTMTIDHDGPDFRIKGGLWDGRQLYDLYREASTPWEWHEALFARGRARGLTVFSTPFDETAVDFLEKLDAPVHKIASFELVDLPLIAKIASTGKPAIMSTGMGSPAEIDDAVAAFRAAGGRELMLLHCISGYPTPAEQANLRRMAALRERYGCAIGLSDHTLGVEVAIAGVALGAGLIEKHFTLRRADGGPDGPFSLEPAELRALVTGARNAHAALGSGAAPRSPVESGSMVFRRSLYVVKDVAAGEAFTRENVRIIRPGFGLPPKELPNVIGRKAKRAVARGTRLDWSIVE
jgi:N-acetylneuraminate synthase